MAALIRAMASTGASVNARSAARVPPRAIVAEMLQKSVSL